MSLGREDDSGSYDLTRRRRNAVVIGNPPHGNLYWSNGSHQESYVSSPAQNAEYWSSNTLDSHFPIPHEGVFLHSQSLGEVYFGSPFGVPGSDASRNDFLMGMEAASPVSHNIDPETELPMGQTYQPLTWTPGERWDTTSSRDHPVQLSGFDDPSNPVALEMQPAVRPSQMAVSSMTSEPSEFAVPTGVLRITPSNSIQPLNCNDPVVVTPHFRSLDERSGSSMTTFQCLWTDRTRGTRCTARITSNRKSVSSHLRDAHDFLCDGQMIECAWDDCASTMQRRNIPRHIVSRHFEIKVECPVCGLPFSRADAKKKHLQACTGVRMPAVMGASGEEGGNL